MGAMIRSRWERSSLRARSLCLKQSGPAWGAHMNRSSLPVDLVTRAAGLALVGAVLAACNILPDPDPPSELQARADEVAERTARIRGLTLKKNVPAASQGKETLHDVFQVMIDEEWDAEGAGMERALKAFGLVASTVDLKPLLGDFYKENVGGYYDPEEERFYVVAETNDGDDTPKVAEAEEFVLAHELTHAIDDQHFDLDAYEKENDIDDDGSLAYSALVEGAAMEGGVDSLFDRFGAPASTAGPFLSPIIRAFFGGISPERTNSLTEGMDDDADRQMAKTPGIIKQGMVFPYLQGWAFTNRLRSEFGWGAVDAAYADPPESTEQILFPERYIDRRDRPVAITLPEAPSGWKTIHENTLGMFGMKILLNEQIDETAVDLADAWDGDRYALWETDAGDALGWVSVWDHDGGAEDFASTYSMLLQYRHSDAGTWAVERRGDVVAAVLGTPKGAAADAARHLLDGATLTRAADDHAPDRWYWKALRFPVAVRDLDRVWETHLLGGLALDGRFHDEGHRFSLLSRWALYSENNPDRTAFWAGLGLIGFTRDRTIDYTFGRIPLAFYWHGRGEGEARRAQWSLGPFDLIEYENLRGAKEFDLLWGWLARVRWGEKSVDGERLRVLFIPIPGV